MNRRAPLLLPALTATALVFAFLLGLPWGSWRAGSALPQEGPYLEIVGHYAPNRWVSTALVGAGPDADLRLTETDIPPILGQFSLQEGRFHYTHQTTTHSAAFYPVSQGVWASVRPVPDAIEAVHDGDRVLVADPGLTGQALNDACAKAKPITLIDATGAWIDTPRGTRSVEFPALVGESGVWGDDTLTLTEAGLWRHPAGKEPESGEVIGNFSGRFEKPEAYIRWGDGGVFPIGITGRSAAMDSDFHVFRRKPMSESAAPLAWRVMDTLAFFGVQVGFSPNIGRSSGSTRSVYLCTTDPHPIGEQSLQTGDVLLAGHTTFALGTTESHFLSLQPTEPPAHRVHALASVSLGRIRSVNPHWAVPVCSEGTLLFRGVTDESQLPSDVPPAKASRWLTPEQTPVDLPLPAWAAVRHPQIQEQGSLIVDLLEVCVDGQDLRVVDDYGPPSLHFNELHGTLLSHNGTLGVGGHTLRFAAKTPWVERLLPLVFFFPTLFAVCLWTARRLAATAPSEHRAAIAWAVAAVGAAIGIGVILQTRMAVSPALLGSGDYLQRHLLTSFLAMFALWGAVEVALHAGSGLSKSLWSLARVSRTASVALVVWLLLDRLLWNLLGTSDPTVPAAVVGDLNRSLIAVVAVALGSTGLAFALGQPRVQAWVDNLVPRAAAWIRDRTPPRWAENPWIGFLQTTPSSAVIPMLTGISLLVLGVIIGGSGRSLLGFDLKLAEFAAWPIGLGLSALLVSWSRTRSSLGRWAVPLGILVWLGAVTLAVVVCYALRGDFGPLMVLLPAMFGTVAAWGLPWRIPGDDTSLRVRWSVLGGYTLCIALGISTVVMMVPFLESQFSEIPGIGTHVQRALDRIETHQETWYTQGGHWSTTANWIAAGYFEDREHFVSNLHSDLAFVALMQSFHLVRALGVLGLFLGLIGLLGSFGEKLLSFTEQQAQDTSIGSTAEARRRWVREHLPQWLSGGAAGYACLFASMYLACEVLVHLGTCFNTLPQTGLTLPWISAGGSASVGFAILVGAALASFAQQIRP